MSSRRFALHYKREIDGDRDGWSGGDGLAAGKAEVR